MSKVRQFSFAPPVESVDDLEAIVNTQSTFYERVGRDSKGQPRKWRVKSILKRWKRDRNRMALSLAHGLYDHWRVESLDEFNRQLTTSYNECV